MGIQGLLPLLKDIQTDIHVQDLKGETIGIDSYCLLHRGAYSCAFELALGKPTKGYVEYCMRKIDMLTFHGVIPYVVFDGAPLPMKMGTEDSRLSRREENKAKGLELMKTGKKAEAMDYFQKCVDITPQMAYELILRLRERKIDYVVAPYEADSQLAFLERNGIISGILTEDSDLLAFGCKRVIFKMDKFGNAVEIRSERFNSVKSISLAGFTEEKFRNMCILSGCDYLPSIEGMGLKTAHRLLKQFPSVPNILRALRIKGKIVPSDYLDNFKRAELTFKHQRVFDPTTQVLVPLTPFPENIDPEEMDFVGPDAPPDIAVGVARGDLHPATKEKLEIPEWNCSAPKKSIKKSNSMGPWTRKPSNLMTSYFASRLSTKHSVSSSNSDENDPRSASTIGSSGKRINDATNADHLSKRTKLSPKRSNSSPICTSAPASPQGALQKLGLPKFPPSFNIFQRKAHPLLRKEANPGSQGVTSKFFRQKEQSSSASHEPHVETHVETAALDQQLSNDEPSDLQSTGTLPEEAVGADGATTSKPHVPVPSDDADSPPVAEDTDCDSILSDSLPAAEDQEGEEQKNIQSLKADAIVASLKEKFMFSPKDHKQAPFKTAYEGKPTIRAMKKKTPLQLARTPDSLNITRSNAFAKFAFSGPQK